MANEKRLIDADALKERAIRVSTVKEHCYMKAVGTHEIDKAPTIDAVPVVRCKDCKNYVLSDFRKPNEPRWCEISDLGGRVAYPEPDDFCSYGERREGE